MHLGKSCASVVFGPWQYEKILEKRAEKNIQNRATHQTEEEAERLKSK